MISNAWPDDQIGRLPAVRHATTEVQTNQQLMMLQYAAQQQRSTSLRACLSAHRGQAIHSCRVTLRVSVLPLRRQGLVS